MASVAESEDTGVGASFVDAGVPAGRACVSGDDEAAAGRVVELVEAAGWTVETAGDAHGCDVGIHVAGQVSSSGLQEAVERVRTLPARAHLLIVSAPIDGARQLVRSGVDGVLLEDGLDAQLTAALAALRAGLTVTSGELQETPERPALTAREKQVLGMVVLGFSNAEIALKLYVTESTVKSHLSSSFAKLGVRTRSEATALILDPDAGFGTGILAIVGEDSGDAIALPQLGAV
jgi:DNA-binding NarL/FixJ family response regulator